jgi:hypothetical protein
LKKKRKKEKKKKKEKKMKIKVRNCREKCKESRLWNEILKQVKTLQGF